jgi:hypothetical protein
MHVAEVVQDNWTFAPRREEKGKEFRNVIRGLCGLVLRRLVKLLELI